MEQTEKPLLRSATCQILSVAGIMYFFIRVCGLHVQTRSGVVDNLAVEVLLGLSSISRCI